MPWAALVSYLTRATQTPKDWRGKGRVAAFGTERKGHSRDRLLPILPRQPTLNLSDPKLCGESTRYIAH